MERNIIVSGLIMLAPSFLQNVHIHELSAQKKEIQAWILGFRKWQMVMTLGETSLSKSRTEIKMDQSQNAGYGNLYTYSEWRVHEKYTVNNSDKKMQPRKKMIKSFTFYSQESRQKMFFWIQPSQYDH